MKALVRSILCVSVLALAATSHVAAQSMESAVAPLPEELRDGAEVYVINMDGERSLIREGSNGMACRASIPGHDLYWARCHQRQYAALYDRLDMLILLEGHSPDEAAEIIAPEMHQGLLPTPQQGAATYLHLGESPGAAQLTTAIMISNMTAASLGMGVEEDADRPWVMWEGTPMAHMMIRGRQ